VVPGPGEGRDDGIDYCMLGDAPSLVWAANLAAIELHAPLHLATDPDHPTALVFDLDPDRAPTSPTALGWRSDLAERLERDGLSGTAKTSGRRAAALRPAQRAPRAGLKRARPTYEHTRAYALTLATELETTIPTRW
jgi:bifunctional non-homologous end joining protein LigD